MNAHELRVAFDRSFAEAPADPIPRTDVLAIRSGSTPLALRQAELAALHRDLRIVHVPSPADGLLGVIALHGEIVPVWDLGRVTSGAASDAPSWIVILRAPRIALAFDALDAQVRVATTALGTSVQHGNATYAVVDLAALSAAIGERRGAVHGA